VHGVRVDGVPRDPHHGPLVEAHSTAVLLTAAAAAAVVLLLRRSGGRLVVGDTVVEVVPSGRDGAGRGGEWLIRLER